MSYRLGMDLGSNSIGWSVMALEKQAGHWVPTGIVDGGVRIYSDGRDPQSKESLAAGRRVARGARRRRDRLIQRRGGLLDVLVTLGLMPGEARARKGVERMDPYALRMAGLDRRLTPHELGRVLFHLNQRRGFRSNRKPGGDEEKEQGKMKEGVARLKASLEADGVRTLGEYLHRLNVDKKGVRARRDEKAAWAFYPSRQMLEDEFFKLKQVQAPYHPGLDDGAWERLHAAIFFQRPLKPVLKGKCEFHLDQPRASWGYPAAQRFRIFQDLAHLRVIYPDWSERPLTEKERALAWELMKGRKEVTFDALRKALGISSECRFNLESEKRKALKGDEVGALMANKSRFGPGWWKLDEGQQEGVAAFLLGEMKGQEQTAADEEKAVVWLKGAYGLSEAAARSVATAGLPRGEARLSLKAIRELLPYLENGTRYDEAAQLAGLGHHSHRPVDELWDKLPYYGEVLPGVTVLRKEREKIPEDAPDEEKFGRISNPSVHVALNQVRKVVNTLIDRYGKPTQVMVELTRELKLGPKRMREIEREQRKNQETNSRVDRALMALGIARPTRADRIKYKLWEELGEVERCCPFCGKQISGAMLVSSEGEVEVEHLLPFTRSLDDSYPNLTVAHRSCNRIKGDRTPWEAWGESRGGLYDGEAIRRRVEGSRMAEGKKRRFGPAGLKILEETQGEFLARHLTDTAYLAKVARQYLTHLVPATEVMGIPGRLTALLRGRWGLNSILSEANRKERNDHRHHAIDAAVVALTDRKMLQEMARANAGEKIKEKVKAAEPPWGRDEFRRDLSQCVQRMVVSHKPDHGLSGPPNPHRSAGRLHEETAFGLTGLTEVRNGKKYELLVIRKALTGFKDLSALDAIRHEPLREEIKAFMSARLDEGMGFAEALVAFQRRRGVKTVRVLEPAESSTLVKVKDRNGRPYKAYKAGSNHCIEIFVKPDGKWGGEVITTFDAHRPGFTPAWPRLHKGARLVMRLFKEDMVAVEDGERRRIMRVVKFGQNGQIFFSDHNEGGNLILRDKSPEDAFKYFSKYSASLQTAQARPVSVDAAGRLRDPGGTFWHVRLAKAQKKREEGP